LEKWPPLILGVRQQVHSPPDFLLDQFGLWNSIYLIALLYGAIFIYLLIRLLGILGNQTLGFSTVVLSLLITTTLVIVN
jgi:hypothetical protein